MSLAFYKVLHLLGFALAFLALGGLTLRAIAGDSSESARKLAGITHGAALVLILVSGFGALARLGVDSFPPWIWGKLALWLVLGGIVVVIRKKPGLGTMLWWILPLFGLIGAWLALYKPGS